MRPGTEITGEEKEIAVDPYQQRLREVLLQTAKPDYPAGMVHWLETGNPRLYEEITGRLPDLIHCLWAARAPIEEFQRVVDQWLAAHRGACSLFSNLVKKS